MHIIADLFTWFFVERTDKTPDTLRIELWREENVIGEMALHRQEQIPSLKPGDNIEHWLANGLYVHSWPVRVPQPTQQETLRFLGAIARTDPFRFNAVKGLLAHAGHLGWERNHDPNNLPIPSLQED